MKCTCPANGVSSACPIHGESRTPLTTDERVAICGRHNGIGVKHCMGEVDAGETCIVCEIRRLRAELQEMTARCAAAVWLVPAGLLCSDLMKLRDQFKARLGDDVAVTRVSVAVGCTCPWTDLPWGRVQDSIDPACPTHGTESATPTQVTRTAKP